MSSDSFQFLEITVGEALMQLLLLSISPKVKDKTVARLIELVQWVRHRAKHFAAINSHNPQDNAEKPSCIEGKLRHGAADLSQSALTQLGS